MADNNKPQSGNLTSNSLIIAALLATGTAFVYRDAPLLASRPTLEEAQLHQTVGAQDVDARLWQDPFGAIAQKTKNSADEKSDACAQPEKDKSHCEPPKLEESDIALVATVSGAPFYEDAEFRRRLRYAVLAGLSRRGFSPTDARRLGYYRPAQTEDATSKLPSAIPFETFRSADNNRRAVLLWIDEDVITDRPLSKLSRLAKDLRSSKKIPIRIIGPQSSDTLKKINEDKSAGIEDARIYAYGATGQFEKPHNEKIELVRTIGSDDRLAYAIAEELNRRNIKPGENQHVALVSELDTLYGASIVNTMEKQFDPERATPGRSKFVHRVGYLRGLDGALPPAKKNDVQTKGNEGQQNSGGKDSSKAQVDARALDLPYGQSQFDYLRRLADRLRDEDKDLRKSGKDGIRAIGVLGNDVFDKLLVLRALKPAFPNAVFFTTDLDTTLTTKSELDWTRNLIVASSLGRELGKDLQGEIAPFRSAYQTSAFLATQFALGELDPDTDRRLNSAPLEQCLAEPLLSQISRSGDIRALPGKRADHAPCEAIQPELAALYPGIGPAKQRVFAMLLALAGVGMLLLADRRNKLLWVGLRGVGTLLIIGGAICLFWEPVASFLTERGLGEEIVWAVGTSVWPSLAISALAIVISVGLIWLICRELDTSLEEVAHDLRLRSPQTIMDEKANEISDGNAEKSESELTRKLREIFAYGMREGRFRADDPVDAPPIERPAQQAEFYDVDTAWTNCVYQGRLSARLLRSAFWSVVATAVFWAMVSVSHFPKQPLRGDLARFAECVSFYLEFFVISFLVMLVVDATLFCWSFARELARTRTYWPKATWDFYKSKLGAQIAPSGLVKSEEQDRPSLPANGHETPDDWSAEILDDWIDLTFIEKRTACIGTFVYYPFVAIALVILAQSSVFSPYQFEPLAFVAQCLALLVLFGCALALRRVAEKARTNTRRHITAAIVRTKSGDARDDWKPAQLEALLQRVDDLHQGAFSPLSQQPFIRALLIPLTSVGWAALVDSRLIPGL